MKKYELKKSIRFKLNPKQIHQLEKDVHSLKDSKVELSKFVEEVQHFIVLFEQFVFQKEDNKREKQKLESNKQSKNKYNRIDIDYKWLRDYTTEDFFDWSKSNNNIKKYFIGNVPYLKKPLKNFIDEWKNISKSLNKVAEAKEESKKRYSETSLLIQKFSTKQTFNFAKDFIQYANPKDNETIKNKLTKNFKKIKNLLPGIQEKYLPSQTSGICLAKASFNYYTINKKPRNYDKEIEKINEQLKEHTIQRLSSELKIIIKNWMLKTPSLLKEINLKHNTKLENLNLKQSYELIKLYKSKAKSSFNEYIQKNIDTDNSYKEAQTEHPLFTSTEEEYTKFVNKTKEIEKNNNQINSNTNNKFQLKEKIQKLKITRGKFFQQKKITQKYNELCKGYEEIAKNFGQNKAKKRAIEKEKQESQMLKYWSLILEENNKHELLLIPLEKRKEVKNELEDLEKQMQKSSQEKIRLYQFYSLTLRALKKLSFSNDDDNSFLKEIKKELPQYKYIKGEWSFQTSQSKENNNQAFQNRDRNSKSQNLQDEVKLVAFYQEALKTKYAKKVLELKYFRNLNNVLDQKFQNISDFESALERACYTKKTILIDKEKIKELLKKYNTCCFEISSYDLSEHTKPIQFKAHTKIWKEFWTNENEKNDYPVRLNPEILLIWRTAKYKPDDSSNKKSRWSQDQWTLKSNFTLNAGSQKTVLSFRKEQDIRNHIEQFNRDFCKHIQGKQIFRYGLDRGQKEKASLCVLKESFKGKVSFTPVKTYKFKRENYSQKLPSESLMIKNLSKVIEQENLFEIEEKPAFDLTTAKLIKGKIVENGDIFTYLKLQEVSTKRKIFKLKEEIISENNGEKKIYISDDRKNLYVKRSNRNQEKKEEIYYWNKDYQSILSIEEIKRDMQNYLNKIDLQNFEEVINNINHLREALAGNIVGILSFLHKQNTKNQESQSIIILEKDQGGRQQDDDISIALEKALYNKFQTEGLAPPSLSHRRLEKIIFQKQSKTFLNKSSKTKQTKSQNLLNQIGLIGFIDPANTSNTCPKCGEMPKDKDKAKNRKKEENWFLCDHCGFDTKNPPEEFKFLDNTDKIAAYNIAKKFKIKKF